ncbi:MrcB family domain-containing protein [Kocuria dechangensis]|nr:DUF3578 domain-containing protein [Kocuria dechangensis]
MRAELEEILELQKQWTDRNTEPMQRRGVLVRRELTAWLNSALPEARSTHRVLTDLNVVASDGSGRKAAIPWCRIHSLTHSPSATEGWYLVYLFSAEGERAYLSLNQGTNRRENRRNRPRSPEELEHRVDWARQVLQITGGPGLVADIDLETPRTPLGRQYELGNVAAFRYLNGSVPDESTLGDHLTEMLTWLAKLHEAEEATRSGVHEPDSHPADAGTPPMQTPDPSPWPRSGLHSDTARADDTLNRDYVSRWSGEETDAQAPATIRREQRELRRSLLKDRPTAPCALCGEVLPARLLIAGHIKPRSMCTEEERMDFTSAAMLVCALGCDALFECGYIVVDANGQVCRGRAAETKGLERAVDRLIGRTCTAHDVSTVANFEVHRCLVQRAS